MSLFIDRVVTAAKSYPERLAFRNSAGDAVTFDQLELWSARLAGFIASTTERQQPVVIYGHKEALMPVLILACMRAGCPYTPIDTSFPEARVDSIIEQLDGPMVLCARDDTPAFGGSKRVVDVTKVRQIAADESFAVQSDRAIAGDDIVYTLFTSGSTGKPKGVAQRAETIDCLMLYLDKFVPRDADAEALAGPDGALTMFNRVPLSFDLSMDDVVMALSNGHTMFSLEEEAEGSFARMFEAFRASNLCIWVSTPSFLEMCLADPSFNQELLPQARTFILCGEVFHNSTARAMFDRFPQARLYNTYGPTETQTISDVEVTHAMAESPEPLPIGTAGPYNAMVIYDRESGCPVPFGQTGEIMIFGKTLADRYIGRPELTAELFAQRKNAEGVVERSYATGDEGYMDPDGTVHYLGRFDLQIKLNGFRVELGEIEEALNVMPQVAASAAVPQRRNGVITGIVAFVVLAAGVSPTRDTTRELKAACKEVLPHYMVPRKFSYLENLPTNTNGKVDRKQLENL